MKHVQQKIQLTKDFPVIAFGFRIPMIFKTVGAISFKPMFSRESMAIFHLFEMTIKGTGLEVCAVKGCLVTSSYIFSAFPWSAVIIKDKLLLSFLHL
ncbi:MAG TPA: hypothetical protein VFF30_05575 [Nitrososphaerales archaeon]|nr:hypothetical protein [Nitrososphaerales archaeon]